MNQSKNERHVAVEVTSNDDLELGTDGLLKRPGQYFINGGDFGFMIDLNVRNQLSADHYCAADRLNRCAIAILDCIQIQFQKYVEDEFAGMQVTLPAIKGARVLLGMALAMTEQAKRTKE